MVGLPFHCTSRHRLLPCGSPSAKPRGPRQPVARSGLCGAARCAGESVCGGEGWQPTGGDWQVQAVALGKAAGAGLTSGAGAAAAVGAGAGGGAGAALLVPSNFLPGRGGSLDDRA